jgi:hypothetical protein
MIRHPAQLLVLLGLASGCALGQPPVRVLDNQLPRPPAPEAEQLIDAPTTSPPARDAAALPATRIGAPGGSGAGSRRVLPTQSGNETVGGLPAGIGRGRGPRG